MPHNRLLLAFVEHYDDNDCNRLSAELNSDSTQSSVTTEH